jgi:hypothetical protein
MHHELKLKAPEKSLNLLRKDLSRTCSGRCPNLLGRKGRKNQPIESSSTRQQIPITGVRWPAGFAYLSNKVNKLKVVLFIAWLLRFWKEE